VRIVLVCPYGLGTPGGVQQQVIELAAILTERGHTATVVAPDAGERDAGETDADEIGAGGRSGMIDVGGTFGFSANGAVAPISLFPRGHKVVTAALASADVVHIHEPFIPMLGWLTLRAKRPRVLTFHADPSKGMRRTYRGARALIRRVVRDSDVASAVSDTAASAIRPLIEDVRLVPNGLDVASYRPAIDRSRRQVAFLGRPDPRKGRDLLLEAWPMVLQTVPGSWLVVMGDGPGATIDGVRFTGWVDEEEKRRILAGSGVFCAPNRGGESFGISLAEGMAAGCAIVASDLPAFEALLDRNGVTFPTGNVDALAASLAEVLSDQDLMASLAEATSERAEHFDWNRVADQYLALYELAIIRGDEVS
jgi:phosphatidylinositol alpha-mannosyltransferase